MTNEEIIAKVLNSEMTLKAALESVAGPKSESKDAEIARLRGALQEIADYDYLCQCDDGLEDGDEHFACPSCWARAALKEGK